MQDILNFEERRPLDYNTMRKYAPRDCSVRLYDSLSRFKSIRAAMGSKPSMIVLYEMHDTKKRQSVGVGHYSLVLQGGKQYWSSYGYPIDYEISATHSEGTLKSLMGDHSNSKIKYQAREDTQTCWKWCLLRATMHKMPETRFKQLFYSNPPRIKTPDDLVSLVTLGMLGREYMVGALFKGKVPSKSGRDTKAKPSAPRAERRKKEYRRAPTGPNVGHLARRSTMERRVPERADDFPRLNVGGFLVQY